MSILLHLHMLPLRVNLSNFDFTKRASSSNALYFAITIAVLVIVVIIISALNKKVAASNKKRIDKGGVRRFSFFALHRIAKEFGLNRDQTRMFEFILKTGGISDPESLFSSTELLDKQFKRAYKLIERTSPTTEELNSRLALLFSTRNVIEANIGGGNIISSSREIPANATAVLNVGDKMNYPVKIISSKGETLVIENPVNNRGKAVNLSKGSKAELAIFTKTNKGYAIETRILDIVETPDGPTIHLVHSGEIKRLSNRRFRRRQTVIAVSFYLVHVDMSNKKAPKMIVDKRRFIGKITDISMGGCSIKTNSPVNSGQRLKIEFTCTDGTAVAALGEVLRTNRTGITTIMHVKFLKVPRKSLNTINAMVFEYADE